MMLTDEETDDQNIVCTPPEIKDLAKKVTDDLIPTISKSRYEQVYANFNNWQKDNKTNSVSETTMIAYFAKLSDPLHYGQNIP